MQHGFVAWILVGLVIGALGRLVVPGRDPAGVVVTVLLGIAGALFAGFIGQAAALYRPGSPVGLVAAAAGAIVLLLIYRVALGRRR